MVRYRGESVRAGSVYLMQSFDATAFRGKQVRYRAYLRLGGPGISMAELFMRVDRPSGVGFHDYSLGQRIRTRDWTKREIVGRIDADAMRVTIGLRFRGHGSAYFADAEFETLTD